MKTFHFASILVLAATVTFACSDDDDDGAPVGTAGSSGAAGKGNTAGSNSTAGKNGTAGSGTAGTGTAGTGTAGTGGSTPEGGMGGAGAGVVGGAGGEGGAPEGGMAGEGGAPEGGMGGEGGAPAAPDVIVPGPTELIGTWKAVAFDGTEVITATTWNSSNIVGYDSGAKAVYAHNGASSFNPGKYSKYAFTAPVSDTFYYCQILYASESLEAAKADPKVADVDKLEDKGCNGFNWTKVAKQP